MDVCHTVNVVFIPTQRVQNVQYDISRERIDVTHLYIVLYRYVDLCYVILLKRMWQFYFVIFFSSFYDL